MKINSTGLPHVNKAGGVRVSRRQESTSTASQRDGAAFSTAAREIAKGKETLAKLPPVRRERVEALRTAIARGEYQVDARALADILVDLLG